MTIVCHEPDDIKLGQLRHSELNDFNSYLIKELSPIERMISVEPIRTQQLIGLFRVDVVAGLKNAKNSKKMVETHWLECFRFCTIASDCQS